MKNSKTGKAKASQSTRQRLPGDDDFLKVSTLKRTLFFLSLVSNLPKDGPGLTPMPKPTIWKIDVYTNHSWQVTFELVGTTAELKRIGTHKAIDRDPR